ncbi:PAS domain-containing protein [Myxococcota bacterium]|nr:PAS domain-containing protein [Myxococcota bacterium]MBU1380882.1 PAS domain-containing protein [Myxococcota bacterium]MBU1497010.1 PAS domain-containing protein [Myxococcota bacterium]
MTDYTKIPELHHLLDISYPDGVFFLENWKVVYCSSSALEMFDSSEEDFINNDFSKLFFWELMDFRFSGLKNRIKSMGGVISGVTVVGLRHGQNTFPAQLSMSVIDEETGKIVVIIRDKSQELRNERKLQDEKRSLESAVQLQNRRLDELNVTLENALENTKTVERRSEVYSRIVSYINAVWDLDILLSGYLDLLSIVDITYISSIYFYDKERDIFELKAYNGLREAPEKELSGSSGIPGQIRKHRRTIQNYSSENDSGFVLWTPLGPWTPESMLSFPIEYRSEFYGVISIALGHSPDVDELKFFETLITHLGIGINNLNQYNSLKELAEKLHQQTVEIEGKNQLLEQSSRMKSVFLANMSHEFKTPLNSIIGFSEILRDGVLGQLTEKQVETITDIHTSGIHLLTLVNDLIALSKIEGGNLDLEINMFHFQSSMRSEFQVWEERASRHGLQMHVHLPITPLFLNCDEIKLRQIISSLLSNAVKFSRRGGNITVIIKSVEKDLHISVKDEGIGIDPANHSIIFDAFQQVHNGESLPSGGAGLGLTLTKKFVELHSGTIRLESVLGSGTTFFVVLPNAVVESV